MRPIALLCLCAPLFVWPNAAHANDAAAAKELAKRLSAKDVDVRLEAIKACLGNHAKVLTAPLIKLLGDKDERVRRDAITALAARDEPSERKKSASALMRRLGVVERQVAKEESINRESSAEAERNSIIDALHDLGQKTTIKPLLGSIPPQHADGDVAGRKLRAIANVAHKDAVEALINFGMAGRRGRGTARRKARDALRYATQTGEKGWNIDQWRRWWKDNERNFDVWAAAEARAEARTAAADKKAQRDEKKRKRGDRKKKS